MSADQISDETLVNYLLGALSDEEERRIEEQYLADDELEDRLAEVERDLIDSYVRGELPDAKRKRFEDRFLASEARAGKVSFARALHAHQTSARTTQLNPAIRLPFSWLTLPIRTGEFGWPAVLRVAAILLVSVGIAFLLWSISSNGDELKEGVRALAQAYKDGRPSDYRISGFAYAPVRVVRGEASREDSRYQELAGRLLTKAVAKHPDTQSRQALGRLYLAEGKTDEAIGEFKAALNSSPPDVASIYNDLAAGLLQKADQLRPRQSGDDPAPEKRALDDALDYLNRGLAATPNFGDAIFNRALCYERMGDPVKARAEWERYLQVDPNSGWTFEAKEHIRHLES